MTGPKGEQGSVSPFVAVISLAILMVVGMVFDGGEVLAAQARARNLAGNAARAGAQEIDIDSLRATGAALLRPDLAESAARAFLAREGVTGDIYVEGSRITVTVHFSHAMHILPLPDRAIEATESATAVAGLDGSEESS